MLRRRRSVRLEGVEALFEEARERARRRRRRQAAVLAGLLALVGAGLAIHLGPGGNGHLNDRREPNAVAVRPEQVLARRPYMGVSCRRANSIACDRVGLAVWTRSPARAVQATIAGRRLGLTADPAFVGPHQQGQPYMFIGFLHHAGLRHGPLAVQVEQGRNRWIGVPPVAATVRLVITYADGSRRATALRVGLAAGWG